MATLQKKVTQLTGLLIDANAASLRQKQKANSFENQFLQNQKMTIQVRVVFVCVGMCMCAGW